MRPKQFGEVSWKNLAIIGSILFREPNNQHFNQICRAAEQYGLENRGTISRCLKALCLKGAAERKPLDRKVFYVPNRQKIFEVLSNHHRKQEAWRRRTRRIRGVRLLTKGIKLPLDWVRNLERPDNLQIVKQELGHNVSGGQLCLYLREEKPSLYRRLRPK